VAAQFRAGLGRAKEAATLRAEQLAARAVAPFRAGQERAKQMGRIMLKTL
jgi:hypothetical protein